MKYSICTALLYAASVMARVSNFNAMEARDNDVVRRAPPPIYEEEEYKDTRY